MILTYKCTHFLSSELSNSHKAIIISGKIKANKTATVVETLAIPADSSNNWKLPATRNMIVIGAKRPETVSNAWYQM